MTDLPDWTDIAAVTNAFAGVLQAAGTIRQLLSRSITAGNGGGGTFAITANERAVILTSNVNQNSGGTAQAAIVSISDSVTGYPYGTVILQDGEPKIVYVNPALGLLLAYQITNLAGVTITYNLFADSGLPLVDVAGAELRAHGRIREAVIAPTAALAGVAAGPVLLTDAASGLVPYLIDASMALNVRGAALGTLALRAILRVSDTVAFYDLFGLFGQAETAGTAHGLTFEHPINMSGYLDPGHVWTSQINANNIVGAPTYDAYAVIHYVMGYSLGT